jgi:hypothetical protein
MPVPVSLYGLASAVSGNYLFSGKLIGHLEVSIASALALLAMRRIGASWWLAAGLLAVFLASDPALIAGHGLRQDALPLALQLAAILLVDATPGRRGAAVAGALAGLAFMSKLTAVWALACVPVWLVMSGRSRHALWFAATSAVAIAGVLAAAQLISRGAFLDNMLVTAASTDVGLATIAFAPLRAARMVADRAIGVSQVLPFAVLAGVAAIDRLRAKPPSIYLLAWLAAGAALVAAASHPGAEWNHAVDVALLTVIAAAHSSRLQLPSARRSSVTILSLVVVWSTLSAGRAHLLAPAEVALEALRGRDAYAGEDLAQLRAYLPSPGVVLSEDPGVSVLLGQDPVILDPYAFRSVAHERTEWAAEVTGRVSRQEFAAVVLVRDASRADAREYYRAVSIGNDVIEAVVSNYRLAGVVGELHVYVPTP